jgi:XXXCH domain-containing protein
MGDKKIAIDKTLNANQVAAFLRLLADELEGKNNADANEFGSQLHGFNKLKISLIKQEGGQLSLRLKVKDNKHAATVSTTEFTDIAEHEYRPFKQRYKATFAELTSCVSQNSFPSPDLLLRFMAQSQQLISFQGFGDPYYSDYMQACSAMVQAVNGGSILAFQEKMEGINALKKACPQRFK